LAVIDAVDGGDDLRQETRVQRRTWWWWWC
jgi:hypothetical protein